MTKVTININNSKVNISINEGSEINISILGNEVTITNNVIISNHDEVISNHDEVSSDDHNEVISNHDEVYTGNHDEVISNHDEVSSDDHDEVTISNHDEVISNHDEVSSDDHNETKANDELFTLTFKQYTEDSVNKIFEDTKIIFNDLKSLNKRIDSIDIKDSEYFKTISMHRHNSHYAKKAIDLFNEDFINPINKRDCDDFNSVLEKGLNMLSSRKQIKGIREFTELVNDFQAKFIQYTEKSNANNHYDLYKSKQKIDTYAIYAPFKKLDLGKLYADIDNAYRTMRDYEDKCYINMISDILHQILWNTAAYKTSK